MKKEILVPNVIIINQLIQQQINECSKLIKIISEYEHFIETYSRACFIKKYNYILPDPLINIITKYI